MALVSKRMVFLYCKAIVVILILCFTVVQLAAIGKKRPDDNQEHEDRQPIPDNDNNALLQLPKLGLPDNDKKSVINDKLAAVEDRNIVESVDKRDIVVNNEHIVGNVGEAIVKDEAPLLGLGDRGPDKEESVVRVEAPLQNLGDRVPDKAQLDQIEEPKHADDVIVHDPDQSQIDEPKEKIDIEKPRALVGPDEEEEDDEFPAHQLKDVRKLSLEELQPPDHMDGVKMEIDGHLNKHYKQEIILGNHEEFEHQPDVEPEKLLEHIFDKVDKDGDKFISLPELEEWIITRVQEHFDEANEETERIFKHLDNTNSGHISWHDFHVHFLVAKGYDGKTAQKHATDYETIPLNPDEKERLIRYKFRWAEADEDPQDNKLNLEEFKAFRHPEQSKAMLDRMVQDILDNLDENSDSEITEKEFVALPPGELDGSFVESDRVWQAERRKEYKDVIDINHDGKVTRAELKNYVDPQNPNHARLEAENLIQLADDNKDDQLSLDEVLDNAELFLGSKMIDTGRNFHDEF